MLKTDKTIQKPILTTLVQQVQLLPERTSFLKLILGGKVYKSTKYRGNYFLKRMLDLRSAIQSKNKSTNKSFKLHAGKNGQDTNFTLHFVLNS